LTFWHKKPTILNIYSLKRGSILRRAEQKEKRRWEIINAALDLFIRKGFAATKIQDIAEAVGMSVGLLFHYFESKEKLYEELIKIGTQGTRSFVTDMDCEPLIFFRTAVNELFQSIKTEPFAAKLFVFMKQTQYNEAAPESVKELLNNAFTASGNDMNTVFMKKIKQGQKNGTIKKGDPLALAIAFWKAVSGIAEHIALTPDSPVPNSEWIVDIVRK
jgi:AcrR family transcriptional regulator